MDQLPGLTGDHRWISIIHRHQSPVLYLPSSQSRLIRVFKLEGRRCLIGTRSGGVRILESGGVLITATRCSTVGSNWDPRRTIKYSTVIRMDGGGNYVIHGKRISVAYSNLYMDPPTRLQAFQSSWPGIL
jgi:hypothetical protein